MCRIVKFTVPLCLCFFSPFGRPVSAVEQNLNRFHTNMRLDVVTRRKPAKRLNILLIEGATQLLEPHNPRISNWMRHLNQPPPYFCMSLSTSSRSWSTRSVSVVMASNIACSIVTTFNMISRRALSSSASIIETIFALAIMAARCARIGKPSSINGRPRACEHHLDGDTHGPGYWRPGLPGEHGGAGIAAPQAQRAGKFERRRGAAEAP